MKRLYLLFVLLVLALAGCGSATTQQITATPTPQSTQSTTGTSVQETAQALMNGTPQEGSTPTNQSGPYTTGEPVSSGPWVIIVNGLKTTTNSGNEFITPKQGDTYLLITITARNADSNTHTMNPYYFTLR